MDRKEERERRIVNFLEGWDDEEENISDAIEICRRMVAKKPKLASSALSQLSSICACAVERLNADKTESWNALERSVQILMYKNQGKDRGRSMDIVVDASPIVKVLLPEATCEVPYACALTRDFFNRWLSALQETYEDHFKGSFWTEHQGLSEYFKKALEKAQEQEDRR